jgi:hypothetical protein
MMDRFLDFSAEATAFTKFELFGTGQAQAYFAAVTKVVGDAMLEELLKVYDRAKAVQPPARDEKLRREIFGDEKLGPIARNIIKMWYLGIWFELPPEWTQAFGALPNNVMFMVSAAAYTEGLLWTAIGANPSGAKAPGYASWAEPPQIPPVPIQR